MTPSEHETPSAPLTRSSTSGLRGLLGNPWRIILGFALALAFFSGGIFFVEQKHSSTSLPDTRQQALKAAIAEFDKARKLAPDLQEAYVGLSEAYGELQGTSGAVKVWEQAAEANPGQAWPFLNLARLYQEHGMAAKARSAIRQAIFLDPVVGMKALQAYLEEDKEALSSSELGLFAIPGTTFAVEQNLDNGWIFLGYHVDETKLGRAEPTPLLLFWKGPPRQKPRTAAEGWYALAENRWMQRLPKATSLITNGDFEASPRDEALSGFPADIYKADPAVRYVEATERAGQQTHVAVLANDDTNQNSSFVSDYYPVSKDMLYLQTGWIQSLGGKAYLGRQWRGELEEGVRNYSYLAAKVRPEKWKHFAGIAEPPRGSKEVRVWLLNFASSAPVRFDDVTLIPIPSPLNDNVKRFQLLDAYFHDPSITKSAEWRHSMAVVGPANPLEYEIGNGWIMKGYTTDEEALAAGKTTPLVVYWLNYAGVVPGSGKQGWYEIDDGVLWVQIIKDARNLLTNGNFEGKITRQGPSGFPGDIYKTKPALKQVHIAVRNGEETRIAVLANDEANKSTGLVSKAFKVQSQTLYLEGGWIRAPQGNAFLGYKWVGALGEGVSEYAYVARKVKTEGWRHVVGVAVPPPGSKKVVVWLLNSRSSAPVAFDNVFFIPIGEPQK